MSSIDNLSLVELLPSSIKSDPNVVAAAKSLGSMLNETTQAISKLSWWDRLDTLSDAEADEMAWQLHVDFYDPTFPIEQKRELVKNAIRFHRQKGTAAAVEELIQIIFGEGKVEEWWEYGGEPGYFQVQTNNPEVTQERAREFLRAVNSVKRLSAHLERVTLSQSERLDLYYAGATHTGEFILIS